MIIPPIRPNPRLAARMVTAYHTAFEQSLAYLYDHLLTEGLDNEASELFYTLSAEDAAHAHTLGRLIRAIGGDPGMNLRHRTPRIDLGEDASCRALPVVRRMVQAAMHSEAAGITELETLSAMAAAAEEEPVRLVLREIITEEQAQYNRLERLARELT